MEFKGTEIEHNAIEQLSGLSILFTSHKLTKGIDVGQECIIV